MKQIGGKMLMKWTSTCVFNQNASSNDWCLRRDSASCIPLYVLHKGYSSWRVVILS